MSKFLNSTYYDSDDFKAIIHWVCVKFPEEHPASFKDIKPHFNETVLHRNFDQINVSFYSGEEPITAYKHHVWIPRSERLMISIKRRNLLMGSDIAALSALTAENPVVPRPLVIKLTFDLVKSCYSECNNILANTLGLNTSVYYTYDSYRAQMCAVLDKWVPEDMTVRIHPRAVSESKHEARLAMLEDRVVRKAHLLKCDQHRITRLEQEYDKIQRRIAATKTQIEKDNSELTALSAQVDAQEEA